MKKCTWYAEMIIVVAWIVAIISLLGVCVFIDNERVQRGIENYNNGICRECGEALEYRGLPEINTHVTTIISVRTVML